MPVGGAVAAVTTTMAQVADELRAEAVAFRDARTEDVDDLAGAVEVGKTGFARVPWAAVGADGERQLAAATLSVRCLQRPDGGLVADGGGDESAVAIVGRSY